MECFCYVCFRYWLGGFSRRDARIFNDEVMDLFSGIGYQAWWESFEPYYDGLRLLT